MTVRRGTVCWVPTVGPMIVIYQELVMNPGSHSIAAWHLHFLYLSAQREPNHYPQQLLPYSPSFSTSVVWVGKTLAVGKNLDLDHHTEIHLGQPALAQSESHSVVIFHEITAQLCHRERAKVLIIIAEHAVWQPCLEVCVLGIVLSHSVDNLNVNNSWCILRFEFH